MAYSIFHNGKFIEITLSKEPINCGGQGLIYGISANCKYSDYCVKIYKNKDKCSVYKDKLQYMISHVPEFVNYEKIRICWPTALVYEDNVFVGFMMPLAFPGSRSLRILETYSIGKTIADKFPTDLGWHNKFELTSPEGIINRIKILYNWALALEIIHKSGKYVIVDVKPDNVLATSTGKISIVDVDSFQIIDGNIFYKGPVATPDYFSKNAQEREYKKLPHTSTCDCFSFSIAAYKFLIGSHPYSGFRLVGFSDEELDRYSDISSHIRLGLYAHSHKDEIKRHIEFLSQNNLHESFNNYPKRLQRLFNRTFVDDGIAPSASEWKIVLDGLLGNGPQSRTKTKFPDSSINENYTNVRALCVLVIDVSGSMIDCVGGLNQSLRSFCNNLAAGKNGFNELSKDQVELGIIEFDSEVRIVREPSLIDSNNNTPKMRVRGRTTNTVAAIDSAIRMINKRKNYYKSKGISYCRPWMILLTDGRPEPYNAEDINRVAVDLKNGCKNKHFLFNAIGIGVDLDRRFLDIISSGKYSIIDRNGFSSLFQMLSTSVSIMGTYSGDDLLEKNEKHRYGSAVTLKENTYILCVFVSEKDESSIKKFSEIKNNIRSACEWIQKEAYKYNVTTKFSVGIKSNNGAPYLMEHIGTFDKEPNSISEILRIIGYNDPIDFYKWCRTEKKASNILVLAICNKIGRSYACPMFKQDHLTNFVEGAFLLNTSYCDVPSPSSIAHEILHCFGAIDLYEEQIGTAKYKEALRLYPNSIMMRTTTDNSFSNLEIDELTAWFVGLSNVKKNHYNIFID